MASNGLSVSFLTIKEIRDILRPYPITIPREANSRKELLLEYLRMNASPEIIFILNKAEQEKADASSAGKESRKRKRGEDFYTRRVARRLEEVEAMDVRDINRFMQLPTADQTKALYRKYYLATSNAAIAMAVCGVCAREVDLRADQLTVQRLDSIPNSHRLVPQESHSAHDLFQGKLLEPAGVVGQGDGAQVNVCRQCWASLRDSRENVPEYSLANNMWIGRTPWELQILTFPEQLLVALLYPRVYVFKLHPTCKGNFDNSTLQRGMKGTVTTYELNSDGVSAMVAGDLMPRPPEVLASVISVTYVGLGELPKNWLRNTFRVRREVVRRALGWLKANNPKYYGNIKIDPVRIRALPEDDVPLEITSLVRQSTDTGIIDQESDGYVPEHEESEVGAGSNSSIALSTDTAVSSDDPDVIPLHVMGTVDSNLSTLSVNEMMAWGMANLWKRDQEGGYAVRHGRRPVNDFGQSQDPQEPSDPNRPNFFEKAFPCLFPYGRGGLEADRAVKVGFSDHIRWALQHHDRRFRRHETFPFVAFGISQHREALLSARIQMRRKNFEKEARIMATITKEKLEQASREEQQKKPISDPAVRLLRQHVHASVARVSGSNQSRSVLRSQLWSTSVYLQPWNLWITINPIDIHDLIAQIFAGENIDLDNFIASVGPDSVKRAQNIAADPYAAAKFFHFMLRTIIETLFGVEITPFQFRSSMGILGEIAAYFAAVEAQNRASLHVHMLVSLKHAPNADEMLELLKQESFRARIAAYIQANLRAYLPGLESAETVKRIPVEKEIAYNRPPNPDASDYVEQLRDFELRVARTEQAHTCKVRRCLVATKSGRVRCKRRAPFEKSMHDFIEETGKWGQKRLYEYMNGWIPGLSVNVRCNNDAKLLTNGADTLNITYYVGGYAVKPQIQNHNVSAILAKGYAYHLAGLSGSNTSKYVDDLRDMQRLLLFRLVHAINREQELGVPMVMSYLMGWGDVYRSHHYTPIYWSSFVGALLKIFPTLRKSRPNPTVDVPQGSNEEHASLDDNNREESFELAAETEAREAEDGNDVLTLDINSTGGIFAKCQVTDYLARGEELADYNLVDFFVNTYEVDIGKHAEPEPDSEDIGDSRRRPGRPKGVRVKYLTSHEAHNKKQRVIRSRGHNTFPNFIGSSFPRRDDPEIREFYCACMLMLLKPWRDLKTDLKRSVESWEHAFDTFTVTAPKRIHDILSNIQYFHSCRSAAMASRDPDDDDGLNEKSCTDFRETEELGEDVENTNPAQSEEGLAELIASQVPLREDLHARMAVELARAAKIFPNDSSDWELSLDQPVVATATGNDLSNLIKWRVQLAKDVQEQNSIPEFVQAVDPIDGGEDVVRMDDLTVGGGDPQVSPLSQPAVTDIVLSPAHPSELKADQLRAYEIIVWHLDQVLAGKNPPPLRMLLHGEGGTGKSKVIQTVTQAFVDRAVSHWLLKAAYTGVAASLINGKTTHIIGGISIKNGELSDEAKANLQKFWQHFRYLILDETSMLAKEFFALLSRNISIAKGGTSSHSFGGVNLIICGDFHQFPPVATGLSEVLYYPIDLLRDSLESKLGHMICEEFSTVVILKEQMRVTDAVWLDFLRHLRVGDVQQHHLTMLRTLIVGNNGNNGNGAAVDFNSHPWNDAALVTPRHAVRNQWNEQSVHKMAKDRGRRIYICSAEDTYKGRSLNLAERYRLALHLGKRKKNGKKETQIKELPNKIELAVGMKVMVTDNIETDLDLTNGARGEIVGIILDPDEPTIGEGPVVHLQKLPAYILVKLTRTRAGRLEGLDEHVIPIEPAHTTYHVKFSLPDGKITQRTIRRRQFPMTAAYAFTDYRSQGQTIPFVLVDIGTPPTGTLSLFNLYVALSRSSGRESIRLLRDFDDALFLKGHDPVLLAEDDRLESLNESTKMWWQEMRTRMGLVESNTMDCVVDEP